MCAPGPSPENLRVLDRMREVTAQLGREPSEAELSEATGLHKTTVRQHLHTLARFGHVTRRATRYCAWRLVDVPKGALMTGLGRLESWCEAVRKDNKIEGAWLHVSVPGTSLQTNTWVPMVGQDETCRSIVRAWARLVGQLVEQEVRRGV